MEILAYQIYSSKYEIDICEFVETFTEIQKILCRWNFPGFLTPALLGIRNSSTGKLNRCFERELFQMREIRLDKLTFYKTDEDFEMPFTKMARRTGRGVPDLSKKQHPSSISTLSETGKVFKELDKFFQVDKYKYSQSILNKIFGEIFESGKKNHLSSIAYWDHLFNEGKAAVSESFTIDFSEDFLNKVLSNLQSTKYFQKGVQRGFEEQSKSNLAKKITGLQVAFLLMVCLGLRSEEAVLCANCIFKTPTNPTFGIPSESLVFRLKDFIVTSTSKSKTASGIRDIDSLILLPSKLNKYHQLLLQITKNKDIGFSDIDRLKRALDKVELPTDHHNLHALRHQVASLRLYEIFRSDGNTLQLYFALVDMLGHLHASTTVLSYVGNGLGGRMIPTL